MSTPGTPKPKRDLFIQLRVTAEHKAALEQAAERQGLRLSNWLLHVGLKEARALDKEYQK